MNEAEIKHIAPNCGCSLCERNRKFHAIIQDLCEVDRVWMEDLYEHLFDCESELELIRASN